jgi:hypothetical protein
VEYDAQYLIGVWVGRPDGTPYRMAAPGETLTWPAVPGRHVFVALAPQSGLYSKPVEVMVQ